MAARKTKGKTRKQIQEERMLKRYKRLRIRIAKELGYDDDIIKLIEKAPTEVSVDAAMIAGRHRIKDQ